MNQIQTEYVEYRRAEMNTGVRGNGFASVSCQCHRKALNIITIHKIGSQRFEAKSLSIHLYSLHIRNSMKTSITK